MWMLLASIGLSGPLIQPAGGQQSRFHAVSHVEYPVHIAFDAAQNADVRLREIRVELLLDCSRGPNIGKKAFEMVCSFEDASIQLGRWDGSQATAQRVANYWGEQLKKGSLSYVQTFAGKIRSFDFEGLPGGREKEQLGRETLRQIMRTVVGAWELSMPKQGSFAEAASYAAPAGYLQRPAAGEIAGVVNVDTTFVKEQDGLFYLRQESTGNMDIGEIAGLQYNGDNQFMSRGSGKVVIDLPSGVTLRTYKLTMKPAAGNVHTPRTGDRRYQHEVRVEQVEAGQSVSLQPTGLLAPPQ